MVRMALHDRDLTPEQQAVQDGLDASWAAVQRHMADPATRAQIVAAVAEVDAAPPSPLNRDEFLLLATVDVDVT
jgi:hypothetical protein